MILVSLAVLLGAVLTSEQVSHYDKNRQLRVKVMKVEGYSQKTKK